MSQPRPTLVIRGGRPLGGLVTDISIENGVIAAVGADVAGEGVEVVDARGLIVLLSLIHI